MGFDPTLLAVSLAAISISAAAVWLAVWWSRQRDRDEAAGGDRAKKEAAQDALGKIGKALEARGRVAGDPDSYLGGMRDYRDD